MGCSNTKFPTSAAADNSSPVTNLLNMSNSADLTKMLAEGEDKIKNHAAEALNKVADVLENAADAIKSPINGSEGTTEEETHVDENPVPFIDLDVAGSKIEEETPDEMQETDSAEQETDSVDKEGEANDETIDFIAICPPNETADADENEDNLEVAESTSDDTDNIVSEENCEQDEEKQEEITIEAESHDSEEKEPESTVQ